MIEKIFNFIYSNWQGIIITLAAGVLFLFISNYFLKRYIVSAEKERFKQAKNALLDILESLIINKQDISIGKINNLLKAIDREHAVILSDVVSPLSLLQDLELRFEKSHHLDHTQKKEYCNQIEEYIKKIMETEETLTMPKRYSNIIESLTEDIKSAKTEKALENLELLKKKVKEREEYTYSRSSMYAMDKIPYHLMIVLTIVILISTIISYILKIFT